MNQPLISVIIPTYNSKKYLKKTLLSVLKQSYKNIEIIVVDDGSTDNTYESISGLIKKNINIYYFYKNNTGCSDTRNYGFKKSKGQYIQFMDSDDLILTDFYDRVMKIIISNKHYDFCFSDSISFKKNLKIKLNLVSGRDNPNKLFNQHFINNHARIQSFIFKKSSLRNFKFDKHLLYNEDSHFLNKYLLYTKGIYLPGIFFLYRENGNSKSKNIDKIVISEIKCFNYFKRNKIKLNIQNDLIIKREWYLTAKCFLLHFSNLNLNNDTIYLMFMNKSPFYIIFSLFFFMYIKFKDYTNHFINKLPKRKIIELRSFLIRYQ